MHQPDTRIPKGTLKPVNLFGISQLEIHKKIALLTPSSEARWREQEQENIPPTNNPLNGAQNQIVSPGTNRRTVSHLKPIKVIRKTIFNKPRKKMERALNLSDLGNMQNSSTEGRKSSHENPNPVDSETSRDIIKPVKVYGRSQLEENKKQMIQTLFSEPCSREPEQEIIISEACSKNQFVTAETKTRIVERSKNLSISLSSQDLKDGLPASQAAIHNSAEENNNKSIESPESVSAPWFTSTPVIVHGKSHFKSNKRESIIGQTFDTRWRDPEQGSVLNQFLTPGTKGNIVWHSETLPVPLSVQDIRDMQDAFQKGGQNSSYTNNKRSTESPGPLEAKRTKRSVEVDHPILQPKAQSRVLPFKETETNIFHEADLPSNVDASLEKAQKFNIWDHFEKEDEDGKVTCTHCLTKLSSKSCMSTHLRRKHVNLLDPSKKVPRQYKFVLCHFDKEGNIFACKHCPKKYSNVKPDGVVKLNLNRTLNYHVRTKHPEIHKISTEAQHFDARFITSPEPALFNEGMKSHFDLEPTAVESANTPTLSSPSIIEQPEACVQKQLQDIAASINALTVAINVLIKKIDTNITKL